MLTPGQVLQDRFRIARALTSDAAGAVYRAWDITLNQPVVIREYPDDPGTGQQDIEELAVRLASLDHSNLVKVSGHFGLPGQGYYLVMPFIDGQNLQQKQKESGGTIPIPALKPWIAQVCDALQALHTQPVPVFHGDVQPANILITPDNKAVLTGLGTLVKPAVQPATVSIQQVAASVYAPYEQLTAGIVDARSDVYSLGAALFTLLSGEVPPDSIIRYNGAVLPTVRSLNSSIPPDLSDCIARAMAMEPEERYQSAAEMKQRLMAAMEIPQAAAAPLPTIPSPGRYNTPTEQVPVKPAAPVIRVYDPVPPGQAKPPKNKSCLLWGGIAAGALVLLGIVTVVILALAAPSLFNLPDILNGNKEVVKVEEETETEEPEKVSPTAVPTATELPDFYVFPAYDGTPSPAAGAADLNSLCSRSNDPVLSPIKYSYSCTVPAGKPLVINMGWCTSTQEILDQNWALMSYTLQVDDVKVNIDRDTAFMGYTNSVGFCYAYRTYIDGLKPGSHNITYSFSMSQPLNDGYDDYQAGTYTVENIITIP